MVALDGNWTAGGVLEGGGGGWVIVVGRYGRCGVCIVYGWGDTRRGW